jgi:DNA-cytosine methyltransferase
MLGLPATGGETLGSPIRLGSVCSGMVTEKWACARLAWHFATVFWCEKDPAAIKFIKANVEPGVPGFLDVMSDEFLEFAPPCDLLVGGFPCQAFSIAGIGQGLSDAAGRGVVVLGILRYIEKHKPQHVLLENVAGLVSRHRPILDKVVKILEELGYSVSWRVLDSRTHGAVPQRRLRVYIAAINQGSGPATGGPATGGCSKIVWPDPVPCPGLSTIFDTTAKIADYAHYPVPSLSRLCRQHVKDGLTKVIQTANKSSTDPTTLSVVLDVGGSKLLVGYDATTCLTKRRGEAHAMFSLQHGRMLSIHELCRLQGLNSDELNITISKHQMGALLGNGFTCTVLARVMAAVLQATWADQRNQTHPATGGSRLRDMGYDTPTQASSSASGDPATTPATGGNGASLRSRKRRRTQVSPPSDAILHKRRSATGSHQRQ